MNQQVAVTEQVPQHVRDGVKFALGRLAEIQEGVKRSASLEEQFGMAGRYQADALRNRQADIERAQATLAEFRKNAAAKGIDGDAVILELGGEPDLTPSPEAKVWLDDPRGPVIGKTLLTPSQDAGAQYRGWAITRGSNIVAADILKFGFRIQDDVLFPDSIEEIRALLGPGFAIADETMAGTTSLKGLPSRAIRVTRLVLVPSLQQYADDFAVAEEAIPQSTAASTTTDGSGRQGGSPIAVAIVALERAAECADAFDLPAIQEAIEGLKKLSDGVIRQSRRLNEEEIAPTGDDYNDLLAMTGLDRPAVPA